MGNFEKDINKILRNHEVDFNPDHWAEMEKLLDQKDKKKGVAWWIYGVAASVVILVSGLAFWSSNGGSSDIKTHQIANADTLLEQQAQITRENENSSPLHKENITDESSDRQELSDVTTNTNNNEGSFEFLDKEVHKPVKSVTNKSNSKSNTSSSPKVVTTIASEDKSSTDDKSINEDKLVKDFIAAVEEKGRSDMFNVAALDRENLWLNVHVNVKDKIEQKYPRAAHTMINDQLINQWDFFAGSGKSGGHVIRVNYDSQWKGVVSKLTGGVERYTLSHPIEYTLSYEGTYGKSDQIGLGFYAQRNKYARWKDEELAVVGSYVIEPEKYGKLRLGGKISYRTKSVETDYLTYNDMIDPLYGYVANTLEEEVLNESNSISTGLGAYYSNNRLFASVNYDHLANLYLTDGAIQNVREERILLGYHLPVSSMFTLTPMVSRVKIAEIKGYTPMFQATYKNQFYLGVAYRNLSVPSAYLGATVARRFRLNASFGKMYSSDELINSSKGFVQAGMSYRFR